MSDNLEPQPVDPGLVKYLKVLVTVLTGTMIIGFVVLIALFVTRFSATSDVVLPEEITLPGGTTAQAYTRTASWFAVVTQDNRILIYAHDGALLQEITVTSAR